METTQTSTIASIDSRSAWRKTDTMWMLGLYGTAIGAGVLFLMPMYAIQKVPAMRKYSGHISNVFVVIMGLIAISAIFYSLFS